MTRPRQSLLNTGIYTVPDAARLSGISTWRIRRWLKGYNFPAKHGEERHSSALWHGQLEQVGSSLALGFLDLMEIRFVNAFLKAGVAWITLRQAHEKGVQVFSNPHPFCSNRFVTDGRALLVELHQRTGEPALLEILNEQRVFPTIIQKLVTGLEYSPAGALLRWRPATSKRLVVLDPTRNFGRPIVVEHGVPTESLAGAVYACGSIPEVARWFEVSPGEVEDAVEFEQSPTA